MDDFTSIQPTRTASSSRLLAAAFLAGYDNWNTRKGYERSLIQWFDWCYGHGLDPIAATRPHIEVWARGHQDGNMPSTIAGKLNALAGFYRYCCMEEYLQKDPMQFVKRPIVPRRSSTNGMSRFDLHAIVKAAEADGPRSHALVAVLAMSGMRISEVLGLQVTDLGMARSYIRTVTITLAKSHGERKVNPLHPRAAHALDVYIGDRKTGPVFVTRTGLGWTRPAVHRVIKRLAGKAGIAFNISPHSFRHAFTTAALDAGVHPRDLQNSLGWKDQRCVSYYDRSKEPMEKHGTFAVGAWIEGAA